MDATRETTDETHGTEWWAEPSPLVVAHAWLRFFIGSFRRLRSGEVRTEGAEREALRPGVA